MIIETEIDGKPCQLIFIDADFQPCSEKEAVMAKVIFEDGSSKFIHPDGAQVVTNGRGE